MVPIKNRSFILTMVGPLTSEQIALRALSFGNSVIIVGVRARIINLASLLVIVGLKLNFIH